MIILQKKYKTDREKKMLVEVACDVPNTAKVSGLFVPRTVRPMDVLPHVWVYCPMGDSPHVCGANRTWGKTSMRQTVRGVKSIKLPIPTRSDLEGHQYFKSFKIQYLENTACYVYTGEQELLRELYNFNCHNNIEGLLEVTGTGMV